MRNALSTHRLSFDAEAKLAVNSLYLHSKGWSPYNCVRVLSCDHHKIIVILGHPSSIFPSGLLKHLKNKLDIFIPVISTASYAIRDKG